MPRILISPGKYVQGKGTIKELPVTLEELGLKEVTRDNIMKVSKASVVEDETIHNLPFNVDADMVCDAIIAADQLGKINR
ncbi:MAG: hypothetical protein ACOCRL_02485 [Bacillota bacterium]